MILNRSRSQNRTATVRQSVRLWPMRVRGGHEAVPVRKTGEVVVKRLVYQLVDKMLAFRDVAEAPDPSDDLVVDTLRARVSFEHPTVFEHEGVVTDRVGLRVELVDLSDENLWVDELIEYRLDRR